MLAPTRTVGDVPVPSILYGTAWKEEETTRLVGEALVAGFRGFDTANQRRHYHEAGVGEALGHAVRDGRVTRDELFLQTKFTHRGGQDHRLPYDPAAPVGRQVEQSFRSSLEHLGVERLDSLVLHGPSWRQGLAPADVEAWRAMEAIFQSGGTRLLGVSNVSADQLEELIGLARVSPAFVQNRCHARFGWDTDIRETCRRQGIVYQGFSLLTANPQVLGDPEVRAIATHHARSPAQVVFRFACQIGMIPLTGTTDSAHMRDDLRIFDFELSSDELGTVFAAGSARP